MTTAEMVTQCRTQMGEDSTIATAVTDAQILIFLNKRMSELCSETNVLVSGWTTSTILGQQQYSVPPEYTTVEAIQIYRTTGDQAKWFLAKRALVELDPGRATGTPVKFAVWGLNVSGDNSPAFWLDPIPSVDGTNDLICYGRQRAKAMVSGGQGPEVREPWQYAVVDGACASIYLRLSEGSRESFALAQRYMEIWENHKREAKLYITLDLYSPGMPRDNMGYLGRGLQ